MTISHKKIEHSELIKEVSGLVHAITGIQLGERQYHMVESRTKKRIIQLGLKNEEEYYHYLQLNKNAEIKALVSLLTTHHTAFFRELKHFEFLENTGLPTLISLKRKKNDKTIKIWSTACSRGQEVYSLSMFMLHYLRTNAPDFTYEILGTDVDPESIEIAKNAVYLKKDIEEIPLHFLLDHWAKGTEEIKDY
ncbi:MAG: hypothetical protein K2X39_09660, partial [Silvanigrellaceae bacterium]|nr:hypothetical protein [Silvanigrellaceae bacterium]